MNEIREAGQRDKRRGLAYGAALLALLWAFSRGILENLFIRKGGVGAYKLADPGMLLGGAVIVLQAVSFCAVPVFAFLLLERLKEGSVKETCMRLLLWSVALEVPYNVITEGKLFVGDSRSPVAATLICAAAYGFCESLNRSGKGSAVVKGVMLLASFSWIAMARIDEGVPFLIFFASLYANDKKGERGVLMASLFSSLAIAISPFYILAPIGFIPIYGAKKKAA